jgi:ferredoxin
VTVPPNRSLLSVVREVLPATPYSCEEGVCGTCETTVLAGVPEHHDEVLTDAERAEGATMMICVGRSASPLLVLDL